MPSVACLEMTQWPLLRESSKPLTLSRDMLIRAKILGWFGTTFPDQALQRCPTGSTFNDMGLYIFDCIIVLTDNRVLDSDLAILRACKPFKNIEAFIVRSKSDQHINNMVSEKMPQGFDPYDPDMDAETRSLFFLKKTEERQRFIDETSQNVQTHLEREKLFPKKVYIICMDAMLATVNKIRSSKAIDEADLLSDIRGFVLQRLQSGC
ncbi:hypothetical protein DFJ58DRAFT_241974 [Suillus subalutaceus]|uniref:uncharacterized protein n=1 Tax=Suillus subalutaceus TaxID=48586 RepID=UPI001B87C1E0|nr:uncharacterized protein DFJ58DRAFT_241974 [Suillus subalutaceus]KAG1862137.1 hypothetical protein DFJ58DRAFT_241974 [Suillus subalutaceus]